MRIQSLLSWGGAPSGVEPGGFDGETGEHRGAVPRFGVHLEEDGIPAGVERDLLRTPLGVYPERKPGAQDEDRQETAKRIHG